MQEGWKPRSWIVPPGLRELLRRFDIRCKILKNRFHKGDPRPLLIKGPTGVGKSMFAEYFVHRFLEEETDLTQNSESVRTAKGRRIHQPVKFLNCASLTETLLESELFGHMKGSFTGATEEKIGWLESANGGVLVLEELGEMTKQLQAKLLTTLESRLFQKVGGTKSIELKAQIIATTNVAKESFREDLWFRFETFSVPPICKRRQDILYYIEHFDPELLENLSKGTVLSALCYNWPGNVREIERVCSAIREEAIYYTHLQKTAEEMDKTGFSIAPAKIEGHPLDYYDKELSGFRFNSVEHLASRMQKKGHDIDIIEHILNYNDLSFNCYSGNYLSWLSNESKSNSFILKTNSFKFKSVHNEQFQLSFYGLKVFCKLFMQDSASDTDLSKLQSLKQEESDYVQYNRQQEGICEFSIPSGARSLEYKIDFPFVYRKKAVRKDKILMVLGVILNNNFCEDFYNAKLNSINNIPAAYKKAFVESFKYITEIPDVAFQDIIDIEKLYKQHPDNETLAEYFGDDITSSFKEVQIETVALDDLRALYYETVCCRIGTSHGYQKRLAEIAGRDKSTISNDLKNLGLKKKFKNPKFNPIKRLLVKR